MTDKVHPIIEAMARAIAEACGEPQAWVAHIEPAKAAAKVLLSMEPTEGMLASATVPGCELDPGLDTGDVRWVYERMTSRARSEMGLEG